MSPPRLVAPLASILVTVLGLVACQGGRVPERDEAAGLERPRAVDDLAAYVDPRIGSVVPGFTNPGATLPHGMVSVGPDTEGPLAYGGYYIQNTLLTGLSHVHMSAGVFQGGQFPLLPITGNPQTFDLSEIGYPQPVPLYAQPFEHLRESAEPGYYGVHLLDGTHAEVTATARAAQHRYTWSAPGERGVVFAPSRDLKGYHQAQVHLLDNGELRGQVQTRDPDHTVYFALRADQPVEITAASGEPLAPGQHLEGERLTLILRPGEVDTLQLQLAISYVDAEGAANNLRHEMPHWDFQTYRTAARQRWNAELGRISLEGGRPDRLRSFYTALYRSFKFPNLLSDVDGRYRMEDTVGQDSSRPRYTQFSLWDTYRGHSALLAELVPDRYRDMVLSLVDYAEMAGRLPRWQLANRNPGYMSGDPAVMFVAEAWCRGLLSADDQDRAWNALLATVAERDEALAAGYLPVAQPASPLELIEGGSRNAGTTLEYALADFALAAMAADREDTAEAARRQQMALNYRNLQDPQTGWIRPRDDTGAWTTPFLPESGYGFQEGTSWQYSWLTQQDYAGLIEGMGGTAIVNRRLDQFFGFPLNLAPVAWPLVQNQITLFGVFYFGNQFAPGNEHDLQAPYVYNYSGAPWKTQVAVRAAASLYTDLPNGLPGNDDLGALSGWLVWTMLGAYPINPGLPLFTLATPEFESATLHRPGGAFRIERGDDGFVNAAALDAQNLSSPGFIMPRSAARLSLETAPVPASRFLAAPPSLSRDGLEAFGCQS